MKLKFLADEDLRRAIVLGVRRREPSVSFSETFELGSNGKDDLTVLEIAARDGRILVSHDVRTMPGHFRAFIARQESPGLILVPQRAALGRVIDDENDWINQICYLPL